MPIWNYDFHLELKKLLQKIGLDLQGPGLENLKMG